jgi:hypothetical protein
MNQLTVSAYCDEPPASDIGLKIEFDSRDQCDSESYDFPSRISAEAKDLIDCDAASTCGSDCESVVMFDSARVHSSFVCGSSVIFRNLHPCILARDVSQAVEGLGVLARVNCPSFSVAAADNSGTREFNFGYCSIKLSCPEEATLLNFMMQSVGIEELLCQTRSPSCVGDGTPSSVEDPAALLERAVSV